MTALAVETIGLSRRYGRRWALSDVSLGVPVGSVVMLAGRNGSGKSTLLRVLATALHPDHGIVRIAGHDVRHERDAGAPHGRAPRPPLLPLRGAHRAREPEVAASFLGRAYDPSVLARVGLEARADDPVSSFSAGMRKRLALARVLLQDAGIVLLDEPYGELDPPGFALLDGVIGELRARAATVIMATHLVDRGRRSATARCCSRRAGSPGAGRPRRDARDAPGGSVRA